MGKYDLLRDQLAAEPAGICTVTMRFGEVEALVGPLPQSARVHRQWWANASKVQACAWRAAGWRVKEVDQTAEWVTFTRDTPGESHAAQSVVEPRMDEATSPRATAPVYPFDEPGCKIIVHEGDIEIIGLGMGSGTVVATMNGRLGIEWNVHVPTRAQLGDVTLRLQRPDLGFVKLDAVVTHSGGRGWIGSASLESGQQLTRVVVHWVSLPWILPAEALHEEQGSWAGHWEAQGAGWSMAMSSRADIGRVLPLMKQSHHFGVTYTGELRRVDGSSFDESSAADALYGWQVALSFALGRWVAPALPVGFDAVNRRAWEQWAPWRCDETSGYLSWWDSQNGDDLKDFVACFLDAWCDLRASRRDLVWHVCHHLIAANHSSTTLEARIMLVQATLEYLSWVKYVLSGARSKRKHTKDKHAHDHLRELLAAAGIPKNIPAALPALQQFATDEGLADGPEVVTRVRNRLVHPKDAREPYRIQHLVHQAWELSMQYGELLLLHELGYRGRFCRRVPPRQWAHAREPVPWAN